MMQRTRSILGGCLIACLSAAGVHAATAVSVPAAVTAAVADPGRPAADRERDTRRLPAETVAFAGVRPGDAVGELLPGGGYYTRILSKVVGPQGRIFALAPPPLPSAAADMPDFSARVRALAAEPGYGNVTVLLQQLSDIRFPQPLDVVWTTQNYHDFHNAAGVDIDVLNRQVYDALKPGGVYFIVDHAAEPGAGATVTKTLHRIDADVVRREVLRAGFIYDGDADLLRRASDPHTVAVFDPSVRGNTDQFMLRFRKPPASGR